MCERRGAIVGAVLFLGGGFSGCAEEVNVPPITAPCATVVINGGAKYSSSSTVGVRIVGQIGDRCVISNRSSETDTSQELVLVSGSADVGGWTLEPGDGVRVVDVSVYRRGYAQPCLAVDSVIVDTTPPVLPSFSVFPDSGATTATNVELQWGPAIDELSDAGDITYRVNVWDTSGVLVAAGEVDGNSAAVTGLEMSQLFFWSVVAVDGAGNESSALVASFGTWNIRTAELVVIPRGDYMMGSRLDEPARKGDETAQAVEFTRDKLLAATEVTSAEYVAALNVAAMHGYVEFDGRYVRDAIGPGQILLDILWTDYEYVGGVFVVGAERDSLAIVNTLSWYGAAAYCDWLNLLAGSDVRYDRNNGWRDEGVNSKGGYRLPTEAEWEYACRAGTTTPFYNGEITGYDCCEGEGPCCCPDATLDAVGYYCGNYNQWSYRPATKGPNGWGLYDMHGGYSDWVYDVYAENPGLSESDPYFDGDGRTRVRRGNRPGTFGNPGDCRAAARWAQRPEYGLDLATVRIVWCWTGQRL